MPNIHAHNGPRGLDGVIAVQTRLSHVYGQQGFLTAEEAEALSREMGNSPVHKRCAASSKVTRPASSWSS